MRTLELNQEQLNMLANCISCRIEELRKVSKCASETEVVKIMKLRTLLDYIDA